jgi:hypothetical protein
MTVTTTVPCPFCGEQLRVRDSARLERLSSPVCLERLAPDTAVHSAISAAAAVTDDDVRADRKPWVAA